LPGPLLRESNAAVKFGRVQTPVNIAAERDVEANVPLAAKSIVARANDR
jgi:hypothetical protein